MIGGKNYFLYEREIKYAIELEQTSTSTLYIYMQYSVQYLFSRDCFS